MQFSKITVGFQILFCLIALHARAFEEGAVTKKVIYTKDSSRLPKIAIDQKTGTVAVLWSNKPKNGTDQTVFVMFINVKKDNQIQYGKIQQINIGGDSGGIAFNTKSKRFVTVWDNQPRGKIAYSSIFSRIYNRKGVSSGGSISQIKNNIVNQHPNIFYISGPNTFLIIFQIHSVLASQRPRSGMYSMILNTRGKRIGTPVKIREGEALIDEYMNLDAYGTDAAYNSKSKRVFIVVNEETSEGGSVDPRRLVLYQLTPTGKLICRANLSDIQNNNETLSWYSGISQQNKAKSAHHLIAYCFKNNLIVKRISKTGKVEKMIAFSDVPDSDFADIAYNSQDDIYLLVCEESNGLSARYLDPNGKVKGKPYILSNNSDATRCTVAYNQKINEFFVVWIEQRRVNDLVLLSTMKAKPE